MSNLSASYQLRKLCQWIDERNVTLSISEIRDKLEKITQNLAEQSRTEGEPNSAKKDNSQPPQTMEVFKKKQAGLGKEAELQKKGGSSSEVLPWFPRS